MANVYDVISHPAFPSWSNSLLIVPLVARTRETSALAMKTPLQIVNYGVLCFWKTRENGVSDLE